jgi:hypothetical protein
MAKIEKVINSQPFLVGTDTLSISLSHVSEINVNMEDLFRTQSVTVKSS